MATTQLNLYNEALRILGERKLASLSENREPRRVLDDIWADGAVDACLEQAFWKFATRAVKITASTTTIPAFGYKNAFDKPSDLVRIMNASADERFNEPLTQMMDEVGFWFADVDPLYVRYVSNATDYGNDMARWPQSFIRYFAAYLAAEAALTLTQSPDKLKLALGLMKEALTEARSRDAMSDPTAFLPQGGWSKARGGRSGSRRDRGGRGQLIGG
jgi:hypothetical protein